MWLQAAKLLILRSPVLEKVELYQLSTFRRDTREGVWKIWQEQDHSWFEELVNSVGVELSGISRE